MPKKQRSLAGFDDVASDNKNDNTNNINSNSNNASKDNSKNNTTTKSVNTKDSENMNTTANNIDMLLQQRKKSEKKHYIGFYATDEVKEFLDQVPSGNKSAIINEALKMVMQK